MGCLNCGQKGQMKALRRPCVACTLKHLGQAIVLLDEARQPEYAVHRWIAVGHLAEAEAEIAGMSAATARAIRSVRHTVARGEAVELLPLLTRVAAMLDAGQPARGEVPSPAKVEHAPRARMIAVNAVLTSPLGAALRDVCRDAGIALDERSSTGSNLPLREWVETAGDGLIIWGMKMPVPWYRHGRHVLFLENGLLSQRSGVWIDADGYWEQSRLCRSKEWGQQPTAAEAAALSDHILKAFDRQLFAFSDVAPDGPVLIALQRPSDAPLRHHFPNGGKEPLQAAMRLCAAHLPRGPKYLVRPHPKHMDEWAKVEADVLANAWRDDFELDRAKDVYGLLGACRALVTVNSTLATEATALGLPVATVGLGCWSGSDVMLECAGAPGRLSGLLTWRLDQQRAERLLCAVLRHQVSYNVGADELRAHPDVRIWVNRMLQGGGNGVG